jgi:hypothetical protein
MVFIENENPISQNRVAPHGYQVVISRGLKCGLSPIRVTLLNPDFSPKFSNPYKIWILEFHTTSKVNPVKNA